MNYSTYLSLLLATLASTPLPQGLTDSDPDQPPGEDLLDSAGQRLLQLVEQFRYGPLTPEATLAFEHQLQEQLRELGRVIVQHTFTSLEPADVQTLPKHLNAGATCYTRLNRKTVPFSEMTVRLKV